MKFDIGMGGKAFDLASGTMTGELSAGGGGGPIVPTFKSTWNTADTSAGSSNNVQVALPLIASGSYNFNVDWGDGSDDDITVWNQAEVTHTYASSGNYTVNITGNLSGFQFNDSGDKLKIVSITSWGPVVLGVDDAHFYGCANLNITAANTPNMSGVTSMVNSFRGCDALNGSGLDNWDVSNVTDTSNAFQDAVAFNQSLNSWDVSSVTNASNMFNGATLFNGTISSWTPTVLANAASMFLNSAFNQDISSWNTANVTTLQSTFEGTPFNQSLTWNTVKVTTLDSTFKDSSFNQSLTWNTANVTTLNSTFEGTPFDQALAWDVSGVTTSANTFNGSSFNQDLSSWDTANITVMDSMFRDAPVDQDFSGWDVTGLTDATNMFNGVTLSTGNYGALLVAWEGQLVQNTVTFHGGSSKYSSAAPATARAALIADHSWSITDGGEASTFESTWNTSNTTAGSSNNVQVALPLVSGGTYNFIVEWGDGSFDTVTAWNQSEVTHEYSSSGNYTVAVVGTISGLQFNDTGDKQKLVDVASWGPLALGANSSHFYGCSALDITATDTPNMSGVVSLASSFRDCAALDAASLDDWDVSAVTTLETAFEGAASFNQDLDSWNTVNVTTMAGTFNGATSFNGNTTTWNTANVTSLNSVFKDTAFNQDIDSWNTAKVTTLSSAFEGSSFNQDLDSWNTVNVTTMAGTFNGATSFNGNVTTWNTVNVTTTASMFEDTSFNQNISSWNTANVTTMAKMFEGDTAFDQDIGSWNTSSLITLTETFNGATGFDQDLGSWDVVDVTDATEMFNGVTLSTANYDSLLEGWEGQSVQNSVTFDGGDSQYSSGAPATARAALIADHSWVITDGGESTSNVFSSTWNTANTSAGSSNNVQIALPLISTGSYNFDVDWGDGNSDTITAWNQAEVTHTYNSSGNYTLNITGTINGWKFDNIGDKLKIGNVSSWGPFSGNSDDVFYGCTNLTSNATDVPVISNATKLFRGCSSFNGALNDLDMSGITAASDMLNGCSSFNQDISSWDVSGINAPLSMFNAASVFNQDISSWNGSHTNVKWMFLNASAFDQDLGSWDATSLFAAANWISNTNISTTNYSSILIGFESQAVNNSVLFGATGLTYNVAGGVARTALVNDHSWTITDGGAA